MLQACAYIAVIALHGHGHREACRTHETHGGIDDIYSVIAHQIFRGGKLAGGYAVRVLTELP